MEQIPLDNEIAAFKQHLEINPRVIFSAKFGDGKTTFLNEMQAAINDTVFITLHPVNYSVSRNEDIFEYIKRDILLELIKYDKKLFDNKDLDALIDTISTRDLIEVASFLFSWIPAVQIAERILKKANEKYEQYKANRVTPDNYLERFRNKTGNIYEENAYTKIISQAVSTIKESGKKVCLIIEDLDRIDPAHIFRILNVFGAHIDDADDKTNKFGFDNIIIVLDYDVTESIFHHFYGVDANYEGYMSKFTSHNVYRFSISEIARKNLIDFIEKETRLPQEWFLKLQVKYDYDSRIDEKLEDYIKKLSVRNIAQIIDNIDSQIKEEDVTVSHNIPICPQKEPFVKFLAILKRMDLLENDLLKSNFCDYIDTPALNSIGPFMLAQRGLYNGSAIPIGNGHATVYIDLSEEYPKVAFRENRGGNPVGFNMREAGFKAWEKAKEAIVK